jgi:hypothetical protein
MFAGSTRHGAGAQAIVIGWQAAYEHHQDGVERSSCRSWAISTIQTAQAVVDGTETMINEAIGLVDKFIQTANDSS